MIVCLDLEGVLIPEIWINVAKISGVKELELTTREEPNYAKLMNYRIKILKDKKINLAKIQKVVATMDPLPGAVKFLNRLKTLRQVIIVSDTFYGFADPLIKKLGYPTLLCNWLETDAQGFISGYRLRAPRGKDKVVKALNKIGYDVHSAGDSYNDIPLLSAANKGVFFRPPQKIMGEYPQFPVARTYDQLFRALTSA